MSIETFKEWCSEKNVYPSALLEQCWNAAKKAAELKPTRNSKSAKCLCGNVAVVRFCQSCLKTHDEYCKVPF